MLPMKVMILWTSEEGRQGTDAAQAQACVRPLSLLEAFKERLLFISEESWVESAPTGTEVRTFRVRFSVIVCCGLVCKCCELVHKSGQVSFERRECSALSGIKIVCLVEISVFK